MSVLEDIQKLIKVDVKIVSDHPYPWHSGSPETASGGSTKPKNSNRSGGAHKSRKSDFSKIKNAGTNLFFLKLTIRNTFLNIGKGIFY
jgi:hypothetical protein